VYSDWEDVTSSGRAFQVFGPATGKARLPMVGAIISPSRTDTKSIISPSWTDNRFFRYRWLIA